MKFRSEPRPVTVRDLAAILAFLVIPLGCSPGAAERTVTGKVTYGGQPVAPASVRFYPESGRAVGATVQGDGSFSTRLAPGTYKVAVVPGMNIPAGWQEGQPLPENQPTVPGKYQSEKTTAISVTVEAGRGTLELPVFSLEK